MALKVALSLEQHNSCGTLVINDITGAYDVSTNPTGWKTSSSGGSNIRCDNSSITEAWIRLTPPIGQGAVTINLLDPSIWQAITPYINGQPFDTSVIPANLIYTLTAAYTGLDYVDGIWTIRIYISDGVNEALTEATVGFYCQVECCVDKLVANVPKHYDCVECNNKYLDDVIAAKALLEALKDSACIAMVSKFNNILTALKSICEIYGFCSNC